MKILIDIKTKRQYNILNSCKIGLQKHNIQNINVTNSRRISSSVLRNMINDYDLVIGWGVKSLSYRICKNISKDFLVFERSYMLDRFYWTSCGFNGLNGNADFQNQYVTSDRWDNVFSNQVILKEWTTGGEYALIAGQVRKDASVKNLKIYNIYSELIQQLNNLNIPVVYRPHPLEKSTFYPSIGGLKFTYDTNKDANISLSKARFCITINSNTGVISLLNGIPAITLDKKSMVYDYSSHSVLDNLYYPNRLEWCHKMAYTQWSPTEIKNGTMWDHLKQKYK
jgi:hypothetical protein